MDTIRPPSAICALCWTSSFTPTPVEAECELVHPHEGVHARCGYCHLEYEYNVIWNRLLAVLGHNQAGRMMVARPKKPTKAEKYGFPDSLYIRTEADGDDTYFVADKTIAEVVNDEADPTIVAHYALVGIGQFHKTVAGEFELTTSD